MAEKIAAVLTDNVVVGECWTDAFPLGLLTFEALERMLRRCVGAVFIVSPDSSGHPNENVMIELGLVAGRMGRSRVALCVCGCVTLPSDLLAVTRIDMGDSSSLDQNAIERLTGWVRPIAALMQSVSCTEVLHGYTGRWKVVVNFQRWRGQAISDPSIAALNGDILLQIPACGYGGVGVLIGKLTLHLASPGVEGAEPSFTASYNVCASINNVSCCGDGSMVFRTQTLVRQAILKTGNEPARELLSEELAAPWLFRWKFVPTDVEPPPIMSVMFETDLRSDWSAGKGSAYKDAFSSLW